ncbi:MAG: glycosyl hydrolase [Isosphaera sp.]|nr:glycosyl hydrolase [Isosphaera sp.]
MTPAEPGPPLVAFHLPQFHPIPENDAWWGRGFTEWTNVTRARPLFPGHYQPHLPADLGFYDLRLPEARAAQADLARAYGVHGFCYYHYWFNGRRLLERPVDEVLASGEPDFPFCLCWANEPWSRNWDGGNRLVLVEQKYSPDDDLNHIRWLLPVFADRRYIRVGGKPLFLVYHVTHLTDPRRTTERWREEARKAGVGELHLCTVQSHGGNHIDPRPLGFDAAVEFAPDTNNFPDKYGVWHRVRKKVHRNLVGVSYKLWKGVDWSLEQVEGATGLAAPRVRTYRDHRVFSYPEVVDKMLAKPDPGYPMFRGVCPSWDNAARRKTGATIFADSTPELYEKWLTEIVRRQREAGKAAEPVFLNAWNEWAEGCHLEPDQRWGRAYLEATARAIGHPVAKGTA